MRLNFILGLLLISIFFSFVQISNLPESDWKKLNLKGQIKELIIDECLINISKSDTNKICKIQRKYVFNSNGFIVKEETSRFYQPFEKLVYNYDNENILTKIYSYKSDTILDATYEFNYDDRGNKIEERIINRDKSPNARYTYKYDTNNRKIEMVGYNKNLNQFIKETFKYDSLGNLLEETSNERKVNYFYKFDDKNRISEKTITTHQDSLIYTSKIFYTFNSEGMCVKEVLQSGNRKTATKYSFDFTGNWITKKIIESTQRIIYTERIIKY